MPKKTHHSQKPLVSVCVITYNQESFIEQCLDNILNQETDFAFEICLGEDASTDQTREICQRYADAYPNKIRLFLRNREDVIYMHGEPTGTFNFFKTLQSCTGDYIAICEGDDFWIDTQKLQKQVDALQAHPECSICFCNVRVDYDDHTPSHLGYVTAFQKKTIKNKKIGLIIKPKNIFGLEILAKRNCIHTPGVLFKNWIKKESFPDYLWHVGLADWALHMNTARYGKLLYLDETLATYRVHKTGFWSTVGQQKQFYVVIGTICSILNSHLFPPEIEEILNNGLKKQIKRVWKLASKINDFEFVGDLFIQISNEYPNLLSGILKDLTQNACRRTLHWK